MDYLFLSKTALFRGVNSVDIAHMLHCLNAISRKFPKNSVIYYAGDSISTMGLTLSGSVLIENVDFWGNTSILSRIGVGQIFAETYACIPGAVMMVNAVAAEDCEILFLDTTRLLQTCSNACAFHGQLIRNLLSVTAQKNLSLSNRILHTAPKSIRGRLISYLSFEASKQGCTSFTIPFDRQQLADYLGVDRSALSAVLSRMQKEGLLQTHKSTFTLSDSFAAAEE